VGLPEMYRGKLGMQIMGPRIVEMDIKRALSGV